MTAPPPGCDPLALVTPSVYIDDQSYRTGSDEAVVIDWGGWNVNEAIEKTALVIDLDDPPIDPPEGCVDPLLWRLARTRFEMHRRSDTLECSTCPRWKRCPGTSLAKDGLATALGQAVKESAYWLAYGQVVAGAEGRADS